MGEQKNKRELTFLDFAKGDMASVEAMCASGQLCNAVGYVTQQGIEKCLKHIACLCAGPFANKKELEAFSKNLGHTAHYIPPILFREQNIPMSNSLRLDIETVDKFYYQTRYPDVEKAHLLTEAECSFCLDTFRDVMAWAERTANRISRSSYLEEEQEREEDKQ